MKKSLLRTVVILVAALVLLSGCKEPEPKKASAPTFSIESGTYASIQTVAIESSTDGAIIRYTADGSHPSASSTLYTGQITIGSSCTLNAISMASGYADSDIASASYVINICAKPSFSVSTGTYTSVQTVEIGCSTPGAIIRYTTDGTAPTESSTLYSGVITVDSTQTIKAIAVKSRYTSSDVASASYVISITYSKADYAAAGRPTSVTIPSGVTSIGDRAFEGCSGLTSITIPSSVTSIGNYAFADCIGLTSITIPSSVTSIDNRAFYGCSGLTSITIPSSVTSIGDSAFSLCTPLEFTNNSSVPVSFICYSSLYTKAGRPAEFSIPDFYSSIGYGAFEDCSGLASITIPSSVTSIGDWVFYDCTGLTSITIPEGVTSIGDSAFYGCTGLISITIPSGVTSIGNYAFADCSGLTSITIPSSVTSIGDSAFSLCTPLEFTNNSSVPVSFICYSSLYTKAGKPAEFSIPAFYTSIGNYAFSGCTGLTGITIPDSVTSIGEFAFAGCSGLTGITIPSGVTGIGEFAFTGCSGLTSITIPSSVTSIGDGSDA